MDVAKGTITEEFVTVVSVGQSTSENFVTVLSIGNGKKENEAEASKTSKNLMNEVAEDYLEEMVEVFRLPGERLGFGLKFEGGNKTSERVRRLFVQSCAEQSPASRAKCSWGTLGEGDEVLSIDGVPVTHMTRLDCVRRLKESQLVIRLLIRYRGALRPEVISAERKMSTERSKIPPELPALPPPVPPRKLRQPRGSADGEANPSPVKRTSSNIVKSQNSTQKNGSSVSQTGLLSTTGKANCCDNSEWNVNGLNQESTKESPKEQLASSEFAKSKQEPPEAIVYLDARSQCGSTHGSTSDDTGSSMSTVVDRFSTSDRVSTISTCSTTSTASEQPNEFPGERDYDRTSDRDVLLSRAIFPFEQLERDFSSNPPDYLLRRLANSEAVTHVESRGEVERITAVVAPNTVLIEETITLQPPLSFQDAPLSYGHEARPDLFYAADLAADSTTHFRPIKDDVELVECVNGNYEEFHDTISDTSIMPREKRNKGDSNNTPPPLPARNHVNRICVNQTTNESVNENSRIPIIAAPSSASPPVISRCERELSDAPLLPPKPLPRKDIKSRRKRPPPPPPPIITPRKEIKSVSLNRTSSSDESPAKKEDGGTYNLSSRENDNDDVVVTVAVDENRRDIQDSDLCSSFNAEPTIKKACIDNERDVTDSADNAQINQILKSLEIGMSSKDLSSTEKRETDKSENVSEMINSCDQMISVEQDQSKDRINNPSKQNQFKNTSKISMEHSNFESIDKDNEKLNNKNEEKYLDSESVHEEKIETSNGNLLCDRISSLNDENTLSLDNVVAVLRESEEEETYQSLDELNDDMRDPEVNQMLEDDEITKEQEDTSDESDDDDYYWQSNLATIGEEEETNSLEYANANTHVNVSNNLTMESEESSTSTTTKDTFAENVRDDEAVLVNGITVDTEKKNDKPNKDTVNGRMENCGGGQRLPPDGDEFPTAYQEFGNGSGQPYRYHAVTRTTAITTNGEGLRNESESFRENETFKLLTNDSNVVDSRSIILPDNKMTTVTSIENVRHDIDNATLTNMDNNVRSEVEKTILTNNVCQDARISKISNNEGKSLNYQTTEDIARKNTTTVGEISPFPCQTNNGALSMNEKKIEIAGYYHKDITIIEEVPNHVGKGTHVDTPPPLPLTGPPKMEPVILHSRTETPQQRKFSLNGELWRQDDKSERSVRDKIAMFSSQNNLDTPLFPNAITAATAATVTGNSKRLPKYKSSEDVCCDDKINGQKDRSSFFTDRTHSSFDLTDPTSTHDSTKKYSQRVPILPSTTQTTLFNSNMQSTRVPKILPINNPSKIVSNSSISAYDKQSLSNAATKNYCANSTESNNLQNTTYTNINKTVNSCLNNNSSNSIKISNVSPLTRATSFSGSTAFVQDRNTTTTDLLGNSQISRTNSLASTFRRPGEDARRSSLNQLIEQRRRSISKLRGLVIPEKETVPINQPIVDLPEIKSRDSILLHQMPRANIQDKWGSQNSLASNTSATSIPLKATTSFKMPAPQIHSMYSPAFKRKSLTVYGTSVTGSAINGNMIKNSQPVATPNFSEPPKSLESICSPTRSDYSFEFADSTTSSPDGSRNRPRAMQRKARLDYDDSDNDSAVSSSQSSISRGFSPPTSPAPSERSSTISSDRSYISMELNYQRRSLIADNLTKNSLRNVKDSMEKNQSDSRVNIFKERAYLTDGSSSNSLNSRSSQLNELISKNSNIPQKQLRRSNSTETNCSTSSTLTSGSQASAESLSRRVLKPQSVEAINRKNILASARCRSGRDLNGSPLIQRKFSDEENGTMENGTMENGDAIYNTISNTENDLSNQQEIKIAYIEVADPVTQTDGLFQKQGAEPELPPKRSIPPPAVRPPKSEMLEPSNDLRRWVRAEVKTLARTTEEKSNSKFNKTSLNTGLKASPKTIKNNRVSMFEEFINASSNSSLPLKNRATIGETKIVMAEISKQSNRNNSIPRKTTEDQNDLLTILTTKSRSRSAIHVDEGIFGRSKSQTSLEDILKAKADSKLLHAQSIEPKIEKNGAMTSSQVKSAWDSKEHRYNRKSSSSNDSWSEDRPFASKIPTLGKSKVTDSVNEISETIERMKSGTSKIPTSSRGLNRRSASVTDMKKVLEKVDVIPIHNQHNAGNTHNRFPSLDSSADENVYTSGTETDTDRCYGESFGSISSLASSTSLISQQELAQLVEEASLEEVRGAHDIIVVLLHKENPTGSVGITLAGGADCEVKEITVHRVLTHSIADKDGRVQRGDRILSINGRSTRGLTHRESMTVLKQPRSEVVLVVSRAKIEEGYTLRSRTASVETIVEGLGTNGNIEDTAWGPPLIVAVYKDGAGLGFSVEGGRDGPLGDRPLIIKKIFTGGAAEKTGALKAGDQLLEVNNSDVTRMSRIEAWSLMKKLHDGEVNLLVRHPATKSS